FWRSGWKRWAFFPAVTACWIALSPGPVSADPVRCTPALKFYCQNIHVSCAGRTRVPTQSFLFEDGLVTFENGDEWRVATTSDRGATILRLEASKDWIRIEADGRFSLRRYGRLVIMTRGVCDQVPEATR
ncbi:MAG: hypothetical protein AAF666_21170, partial [Pseudomonadota bacterium]